MKHIKTVKGRCKQLLLVSQCVSSMAKAGQGSPDGRGDSVPCNFDRLWARSRYLCYCQWLLSVFMTAVVLTFIPIHTLINKTLANLQPTTYTCTCTCMSTCRHPGHNVFISVLIHRGIWVSQSSSSLIHILHLCLLLSVATLKIDGFLSL